MNQQNEVNFAYLYAVPYDLPERIQDYFSLTRNRAIYELCLKTELIRIRYSGQDLHTELENLKIRNEAHPYIDERLNQQGLMKEIHKELKKMKLVNMYRRSFQTLNRYKCNVGTLMQNEFYETFLKEAISVMKLLKFKERFPLQYEAQIDFHDSDEGNYLLIRASDELVYQFENNDEERRLIWKYSHFREYLQYITAGVSLVVVLIEQRGDRATEIIHVPAFSVKDKYGQYNFYLPWNNKVVDAFDEFNIRLHEPNLAHEQRQLFYKKSSKEKTKKTMWQGQFKIYVQPTSMLASYKAELNALIEFTDRNIFKNIILQPYVYRDQEREMSVYGEQIFESFDEFRDLLTHSNNSSFSNSEQSSFDQQSSSYSESEDKSILDNQQGNHQYNEYQWTAIEEALDYRKYITCINGPPGTGKTQTSLGLIGVFALQQTNYPNSKDTILALGHSNTVVNDFVRKISQYIGEIQNLLHLNQANLKIIRVGRPDKCDDDIAQFSLEILSQNRFFAETLNEGQITRLEQLRDRQNQQVFSQGNYNQVKLHEYIDNMTKYNTQLASNEWMEEVENLQSIMSAIMKTQSQRYEEIQLEILKPANIIVSTLNSSASQTLTSHFKDKNIRMCIVDEAPTASETTLLIPIAHYPQIQKLVLLGDIRQLGIITNAEDSKEYRFDQSMYERLIDVAFGQNNDSESDDKQNDEDDQQSDFDDDHQLSHIKRCKAISLIDLLMQYRQMENLASITSDTFYDERLINGPQVKSMKFPKQYKNLLRPENNSLFFDVMSGQESKDSDRSSSNELEAKAIVDLVRYLTQKHPAIQQEYQNINHQYMRKFIKRDISIIVAYRAQYRLLKELLIKKNLYNYVELDTIDAFQGKENLFVIISLVRSEKMGFLTNKKRCNVALSRAKYGQFIFGNKKLLKSKIGSTWKKIIDKFKQSKWIRKYTFNSSRDPYYFEDILTQYNKQTQ